MPDILDSRALSEYLGIGRDKSIALMRSQGFPSLQLGKKYIVTSKALEEWLDHNRNQQVNL